MKAKLLNVNETEYHADPCARPSLSASIASVLVSKSPLHAWSAHPKLGGKPEPPTDEMDGGTIIHKLILGVGREIVTCPYDDWRKQIARDEKQAIIESGKIPVLERKMDEYEYVASAITTRLDNMGISFDGAAEQAFEWEETADDGTPVLCRAMMDHVVLTTLHRDDLKTSRVSVNPRILSRWADAYGWDVKEAAYLSALEHYTPQMVGRIPPMRFVCAETIPPYDVVARPLDAAFRTMGQRKWRRAVNEWAKCLRTKEWPGYSSDGVIEAPGWAMAALLESEDIEATNNKELEAWQDGKENAFF